MCKAFSAIVARCVDSPMVYWRAGLDSHNDIAKEFGVNTTGYFTRCAVGIEITPDDGYLEPDGPWTFRIDD